MGKPHIDSRIVSDQDIKVVIWHNHAGGDWAELQLKPTDELDDVVSLAAQLPLTNCSLLSFSSTPKRSPVNGTPVNLSEVPKIAR